MRRDRVLARGGTSYAYRPWAANLILRPWPRAGSTTARRWSRRCRSTPPATSRWTTSPRRTTRCPSTRPSAGRCSSSTRPSRAALRRRVRRSLRAGEDEGWRLVRDRRFEEVLAACARPREPGDGVWITDAPAAPLPPPVRGGPRPLLRDRGRRRAGRRPGRRPARPRGHARVDVPPRTRRRQRPARADPRRARRARLRPVRHPAAHRAHHPHGRAARGARGLRGAPARGALS